MARQHQQQPPTRFVTQKQQWRDRHHCHRRSQMSKTADRHMVVARYVSDRQQSARDQPECHDDSTGDNRRRLLVFVECTADELHRNGVSVCLETAHRKLSRFSNRHRETQFQIIRSVYLQYNFIRKRRPPDIVLIRVLTKPSTCSETESIPAKATQKHTLDSLNHNHSNSKTSRHFCSTYKTFPVIRNRNEAN